MRAFGDALRAEHGADFLVRSLCDKGDIGNGIRARKEFESSRHLFDLCIYVHDPRKPTDETFELDQSDADLIVLNDRDRVTLGTRLYSLARTFRPVPSEKPRVYLACPISLGDKWKNFNQAARAQYDLMRGGCAVLNPAQSMFAGVYDEEDSPHPSPSGHAPFNSLKHQDWLDTDLPWVSVADAVLRLPGLSKGADREVEKAKSLGIPVFTSSTTLLDWVERRKTPEGLM
jgi:hypothetical protein